MERGLYQPFAHLVADNATLYRAILELFTEAKDRFALNLRPQEIWRQLQEDGRFPEVDLPAVDRALAALADWGNLEAHPDTSEVATVEDFYRLRLLYQLSRKGEAVERGLGEYVRALERSGELQSAALADIRDFFRELELYAREESPDPGKVRNVLDALRVRFDELTSRAQIFIASLYRHTELHRLAEEDLVRYKERLIDYLEKFIRELILIASEISETLLRLDGLGVPRLLELAAERETVNVLAPTEAEAARTRETALSAWQARWAGLRHWFIGSDGSPSQAEVLRARARSAIPPLLAAVAGMHERRTTRTDRATELRTLARWFAEAPDEPAAHQLWRAAFCLSPARHLLIDRDSLARDEDHPVSAQTSWLDAPPLRLSPRLRAKGRYARAGRPNSIVDRTREKAELARLAESETLEIEEARVRLALERPVRLSCLGMLDRSAFGLFLDLLGSALTRKRSAADSVEADSSDGSLHIVLEPLTDGSRARIETENGVFSGDDHLVTITRRHQTGAPHA